jgi:hypothetical protein
MTSLSELPETAATVACRLGKFEGIAHRGGDAYAGAPKAIRSW